MEQQTDNQQQKIEFQNSSFAPETSQSGTSQMINLEVATVKKSNTRPIRCISMVLCFIIIFGLIKYSNEAKDAVSISLNQGQIYQINGQLVSWIHQKIDHFNHTDQRTFNQKVRISNQLIKKSVDSPIFLCICGESPCNYSLDFLNKLAKQFGSQVLYLEHRYYGQSLPFGLQSFKLQTLKFLTINQAIEDLAYFIRLVKAKELFSIHSQQPWIILGGSYPGTLSALFRFRHPQLCIGAVASSPALRFQNGYPEYDQQVWKILETGGKQCLLSVTNQLNSIYSRVKQAKYNESLRYQLKLEFQILEIQSDEQFMLRFAFLVRQDALRGSLFSICEYIKVTKQKQYYTKQIRNIKKITQNDLTSQQKLEKMQQQRTQIAWLYQICSELNIATVYNPSYPIDPDFFTIEWNQIQCKQVFGHPLWEFKQQLNNELKLLLKGVDNLIVTYGQYDPWNRLSIKENTGQIIVLSAKCNSCSHCFDLSSREKEVYDIHQVHEQQLKIIRNWLKQHTRKNS